jgi:AcrR family transcriptional regulator
MKESEHPETLESDPSGEAKPRRGSGEKLEQLLAGAAGLMARMGYSQTSIRDVSRETGFSLAGMYYYFDSKEDLLYQIQRRTFTSLLEGQEEELAGDRATPEEKLRLLVGKHLSYFTKHFNELKVCTLELHSLEGERYQEIQTLRRRYFDLTADVVAEVMGVSKGKEDRRVRHATLFIFGMLNWIFMWFDPERDGPVEELGEEMMRLVLHGLAVGRRPKASRG